MNKRRAFTLVELLVVIGIIGVLIGLLMPALTKARAQANSLKCKANLRTLGQALFIYQNENGGYLYPVGPKDLLTGKPTTFGTTLPPHERWPVKLFKFRLPDPLPYDTAAYPPSVPPDQRIAHMQKFPAEQCTPAVLVCPSDIEPFEAHSYVLNSHLADKTVKAGSKNFGGLTTSQVITAGEKVTTERDYYMEAGPIGSKSLTEFNRVVEKFRHGVRLGSNYLYHDGHVDTKLPPEALTGIDPWDLRKPDTVTGT